MKYESLMCQTIRKTVIIEAPDRNEAFHTALLSNPGFSTDSVAEIDEYGEVSVEHVLEGICENCDKLIWDGEKYFTGAEDGVKLCVPCFEAMVKSEDSRNQRDT